MDNNVHVAALLDHVGVSLATATFSTTAVGHRQLLAWGPRVRDGAHGRGEMQQRLCRSDACGRGPPADAGRRR